MVNVGTCTLSFLSTCSIMRTPSKREGGHFYWAPAMQIQHNKYMLSQRILKIALRCEVLFHFTDEETDAKVCS